MKIENWAVIIPLANEEADFLPLIEALKKELDALNSGKVYLITDNASKDRTTELCHQLAATDSRFVSVWAPENRNVVDAYLRGYREALRGNHEYIIEMDAGLSHDPAQLHAFLREFSNGYECVFGSRFIKGGTMGDSPFKRRFLSKAGTTLSNVLLGTSLRDMTSGYQGFRKHIVAAFLNYQLHSKAHFYQTELRYLLRKKKIVEIPITYKAPSPRVSQNAIKNSLQTLWFYFIQRLKGKAISL
ncbi:MAG: glycosyltransferase [Bacteroidia bacterium]|jgi:dolichol-phosphate mannosyltransferase|nr:glycosyltransferase [Bacteroidia bacterium]